MPTLQTYADKTGTPKRDRWSEVYADRREAGGPQVSADEPQHPPMNELFSDPGSGALWEISFQKCLRQIERWWQGLPDTQQYAADVVLEKRLRPNFSLPPAPKPSLIPDVSAVRLDLARRVVSEGIALDGSAEMPGMFIRDILNASHFSNDPGSWSITVENESEYRAIPRELLLDILAAYPRSGQANTATEAVADVISWLYAHGLTAFGQVIGRGRYAIAIVRNDDGRMDVVCYDPHHYQRVLDPDFRATPEEVHSGKYNGYREGPYDTRYGTVII